MREKRHPERFCVVRGGRKRSRSSTDGRTIFSFSEIKSASLELGGDNQDAETKYDKWKEDKPLPSGVTKETRT